MLNRLAHKKTDTPVSGCNESSSLLFGYGPIQKILQYNAGPIVNPGPTLCVQLHLFHTDQAEEIAKYLSHISIDFTLLVSISQNENASYWKNFFLTHVNFVQKCLVRHAPNRGRDTLPWVVLFKNEIVDHDLLIHIHTKKSVHNDSLGSWREFLFHHVLGSVGVVSDIYNSFVSDSTLGLVYPPYFSKLKNQPQWGDNKNKTNEVLRLIANYEIRGDCPNFPAGSFFWCRTAVITPLLQLNFSEQDFGNENGEIDGTLAHAIERAIGALGGLGVYTKLCASVDISFKDRAEL